MPRKKKICIVVIGAESSGTRLATRLCIAAGCHGEATALGQQQYGGWPQKYDVQEPEGETPIVIRRTMPYHPYRDWFDLHTFSERIEGWGYEVRVVVTVRELGAVAASQRAHFYTESVERGEIECDRVHDIIDDWLTEQEYKHVWMDYEDLIKAPLKTINSTLWKVGIPKLTKLPFRIVDGNSKYMEK